MFQFSDSTPGTSGYNSRYYSNHKLTTYYYTRVVTSALRALALGDLGQARDGCKIVSLSSEGQRETQLVDWLSQLQGIEGSTQAQSDAWSQFLGVSQSGQTGVGNLGLNKGRLVQSVLGGEFDVDVGRLDGVPGGLSTNFDQWGDLVEVSGSEDGQVGGGSGGQSVVQVGVTDTDRVLVDLGGGDVVTQFGTGGEAIVGDGQVSSGNWTLQQVKEQSGVDGGLLVEEVQLGVSRAVWNNRGVQLTLQAWGQQFGQFDLGVQGVGVVPALGQGQASGLVDVLGIDGGGNGLVLGGLTLDGEGDAVRSNGLDVNGSGRKVEEVLVEQVVGWFLDIGISSWSHFCSFN